MRLNFFIADPRVKQWFLMKSPALPLLIILLYLYFVQKLGPQLMKNRAPLKIEKVIILYNAVQVVLAAYTVEEVNKFCFSFFSF